MFIQKLRCLLMQKKSSIVSNGTTFFAALDRFRFGPSFISWIKPLYASPTASFRTNSDCFNYFSLHHGIRQGCSLSPYLFNITIEPLAMTLRANDKSARILRGNSCHKVSLYADDLLLYIANPTKYIPWLIDPFHKFGRLSGYKLNFSKNLLFPVSQLVRDLNYDNFPFKLELNSFNYLGVTLTHSYKDLYIYNFKKLVNSTKLDLVKWSSLPLQAGLT